MTSSSIVVVEEVGPLDLERCLARSEGVRFCHEPGRRTWSCCRWSAAATWTTTQRCAHAGDAELVGAIEVLVVTSR